MHIEGYREKKKSGHVSFEFAESGRIAVLERRYDETTGVPMLKPTQETDSREMEGVITESQKRVAAAQAILDDDLALQADIVAKEAEAEKLAKEAAKK